MEINITYKTITVPENIIVDGIDYPIHRWNIDVVKAYEATRDKKILEKLKNFSLDI